MISTPEFLKNKKEEIDNDSLKKLAILVNSYLKHQLKIEILEKKLKEEKKLFNDYNQTEIPQFLLKNGLSEIKLDTGEKITIKENISITIINEDLFFIFLNERKESDIIKTNFAFDRMNNDKLNSLFSFLNQFDYDYNAKKSVHSQTKTKYFKELLGIGKEDIKEGLKNKKYLRKEELELFVNIFNFYSTKIK